MSAAGVVADALSLATFAQDTAPRASGAATTAGKPAFNPFRMAVPLACFSRSAQSDSARVEVRRVWQGWSERR